MGEETDKPHDHLEIHALVDGGYVVREGRFDYGLMAENREGAQWHWRQERAAFTRLEDAVDWVQRHMVDKSSMQKTR